MISGKPLNSAEPQFPHLQDGAKTGVITKTVVVIKQNSVWKVSDVPGRHVQHCHEDPFSQSWQGPVVPPGMQECVGTPEGKGLSSPCLKEWTLHPQ